MEKISLLGNTGIQFLDIKISIDEKSDALRIHKEISEQIIVDEDGSDAKTLIFPELTEQDKFVVPGTQKEVPEHQVLSIKARPSLACFEGEWVPVPFFKKRYGEVPVGQSKFQPGPLTWARMWINPTQNPSAEYTHDIVLAFDTTCGKVDDDYLIPTDDDFLGAEFGIAVNFQDALPLVDSEWVQVWLDKCLKNNLQKTGYKENILKEYQFLSIGMYLTFLETLHAVGFFPEIIMYGQNHIDAEGRRKSEVEVELVLDIGNSRSCGLLLETSKADQPFSFTDATTLALRDMSLPSEIYSEPFEMCCEFSKAELGFDSAAKMSGRRGAFEWPSLVRVGPEAVRLSVLKGNRDYQSGMSSPKRYLWDDEKRTESWVFNNPENEKPIPIVTHHFSSLFTETGELSERTFAGEAKYSRKSLMMFCLVEIILQALSQINSYKFRKQSGQEMNLRKLRRIVLTCPTAMMDSDKRAFRKCAEEAIMAIQSHYSDTAFDDCLQIIPPSMDVGKTNDKSDWGYDEATCSQLAFMYGELTSRYLNNAEIFFKTEGKVRTNNYDLAGTSGIDFTNPAITVASLDIGGGTTDLMICTHYSESTPGTSVLTPFPEFYEGFNLAGDDILKRIVERLIIPTIRKKAEELGLVNLAEAVNDLFGSDLGSHSFEDKERRKQFASQIALPIALGAIEHAGQNRDMKNCSFDSFFIDQPYPRAELIEYLDEKFCKAGSKGFRLQDVEWMLNTTEINLIIRQVCQPMLASLCGVIAQFDCDYLLLAGRPSTLPVVREILNQYMPLTPDRIIGLGDYRIGTWYPFARATGVIDDPKTTVAVGASIALMSGTLGRIEGFRFNTKYLKERIKSTACNIGTLNPAKSILNDVWFGEGSNDDDVEIVFNGSMMIGMRQMNTENWMAAPMYKITFRDNDAACKLSSELPLKLTIHRSERDGEMLKGPRAGEIVSKNGNTLGDAAQICLKYQTLIDENGHWLDTGSFHLSLF